MEEIKEGYTRVSEVLGQWDKFGGINPAVLEAKCNLGSRVHASIKSYHEGLYLPWGDEGDLYVDSFRRWHESSQAIVHKSEMRLYDDQLRLTGCIDALAMIPGNDMLVILDYKTSYSEDPKGWPLQGAFYYHLAIKNGYNPSTQILFIQLQKDGSFPRVREYTYTNKLFNVCMSALNCYRYLKSH